MTSLFISYRRGGIDDGASHHLAEDFRKAFGTDEVFQDKTGIGVGKFEDQLRERAQSSRAIVVVIGTDWIERIAELQNPEDWVRLEIEAGIQAGVLIIPIILERARLPDESELPASLQKLVTFQAVQIHQSHWNEDVEQLIEELSQKSGIRWLTRRGEPLHLRRVFAIAIDYFVVIVALSTILYWDSVSNNLANANEATEPTQFKLGDIVITILAFIVYHWFLVATWGRTVGKFACGIMVCDLGHGRLNWWRAGYRSVLQFLGFFTLGYSYFLGFMGPAYMAGHDRFAKTMVVRAGRFGSLN